MTTWAIAPKCDQKLSTSGGGGQKSRQSYLSPTHTPVNSAIGVPHTQHIAPGSFFTNFSIYKRSIKYVECVVYVYPKLRTLLFLWTAYLTPYYFHYFILNRDDSQDSNYETGMIHKTRIMKQLYYSTPITSQWTSVVSPVSTANQSSGLNSSGFLFAQHCTKFVAQISL